MAEAIRRKYGWTPFLTETRHFEGNDKRILYGWGQLLGKDRSGLNRLETPLPPAVMEAAVWGREEATTIILGLGRPAPAEEPAFELKL